MFVEVWESKIHAQAATSVTFSSFAEVRLSGKKERKKKKKNESTVINLNPLKRSLHLISSSGASVFCFFDGDGVNNPFSRLEEERQGMYLNENANKIKINQPQRNGKHQVMGNKGW